MVASWYDNSWLIEGEFNMVLNKEENIGGDLVRSTDFDDFRALIETTEHLQFAHRGNPFIRWNVRARDDCIFERFEKS